MELKQELVCVTSGQWTPTDKLLYFVFISAHEPFPPDVQQCSWGIKLVQSADLVLIWVEMNTTNNG